MDILKLNTDSVKAFVIPLTVSDIFLIRLYMSNKPRIAQFEKDYKLNNDAFVKKEIKRTSKSRDFIMIFKILPAIIILAAILLMFFSGTNWRASSITIIVIVSF